jgi:hypothetical protein
MGGEAGDLVSEVAGDISNVAAAHLRALRFFELPSLVSA